MNKQIIKLLEELKEENHPAHDAVRSLNTQFYFVRESLKYLVGAIKETPSTGYSLAARTAFEESVKALELTEDIS